MNAHRWYVEVLGYDTKSMVREYRVQEIISESIKCMCVVLYRSKSQIGS